MHPMFRAALFTTAETWKQSKRSSTDEWIKKVWYIYVQGNITQPLKGWTMPSAATWMDVEITTLRQRKTNHLVSLTCRT